MYIWTYLCTLTKTVYERTFGKNHVFELMDLKTILHDIFSRSPDANTNNIFFQVEVAYVYMY